MIKSIGNFFISYNKEVLVPYRNFLKKHWFGSYVVIPVVYAALFGIGFYWYEICEFIDRLKSKLKSKINGKEGS